MVCEAMSARPFLKPAPLIAMALLFAALIPAPACAAESYAHDAMGRLTDATYNNGSSIHYTYDANGNLLSIVSSLTTLAVDPKTPASYRFALGAATPNPGSGPRSIEFSIAAAGRVKLSVTDVAGRAVATLHDRDLAAGRYVARFATDRFGAGVYYFRLTSAGRSLTGRMTVVR